MKVRAKIDLYDNFAYRAAGDEFELRATFDPALYEKVEAGAAPGFTAAELPPEQAASKTTAKLK